MAPKRGVLIFTEASSDTGLGHLIRCTAIYRALEQAGFEVRLVLKTDGFGAEYYETLKVYALDWIVDRENNALFSGIYERESGLQFEFYIVDSYLANSSVYQRLSSELDRRGGQLLCLDDTNRIQYPEKAYILNPAVGAELDNGYSYLRHTLLLGARFALLRDAFRILRSGKTISNDVNVILILAGGQANQPIFSICIEAAKSIFPKARICIVTGADFRMYPDSQKREDIEIYCNVDAATMKKIMQSSDLAISAGGQTLYELAATGVPIVGFEVADNQRFNISGLERIGALVAAGSIHSPDFQERISTCLKHVINSETRAKMSRNARALVDGRGPERLAKICAQRSFPLQYRHARAEDVDLYFHWANDEVVRRHSYNAQAIGYAEHVDWFNSRLNNPRVLMLIFSNLENGNLGQVRIEFPAQSGFENVDGSCGLIGISIASEFRGKGLASQMIGIATEVYKNEIADINIEAWVQIDNESSAKAFRQAGYREKERKQIMGKESYILEYSKKLSKSSQI